MARKFARILISIWDDDDFLALRTADQHAYFALVSSSDLSWCGVAPLLPQRFSKIATDMTPRKFANALDALEAGRFVIIDRETAEVSARTFVRHDDILKMPNVTKAMGRAFGLVRSPAIRSAIVSELGRAYHDDPEARGWGSLEVAYPELFADVIAKGSRNPFGNPSRKAS